jgi:hypothetical protein
MVLKVYFLQKKGREKEHFVFELKSNSKVLYSQLKAVMKEFCIQYYLFKEEKGFIEYDFIELFTNNQKKETIFPIKLDNGIKINIEYLLNFNWTILTEIDVYKIIAINFPSLIWMVKENKRNRIRNLASTNNPYLLSNGQGIVKFNIELDSIIIYSDPLYVKKSHFKTMVKYKGQ